MFEAKQRSGIWYVYCSLTNIWSGAQMSEGCARGTAHMLNNYHTQIACMAGVGETIEQMKQTWMAREVSLNVKRLQAAFGGQCTHVTERELPHQKHTRMIRERSLR